MSVNMGRKVIEHGDGFCWEGGNSKIIDRRIDFWVARGKNGTLSIRRRGSRSACMKLKPKPRH